MTLNVGDGILESMRQYGDHPLADSIFATNSDGSTVERCDGLLARYTASNAIGQWEVIAEARNAPPLVSTALVRGIDVSSHQPRVLTDLIGKARAQHVVVHLYHDVEFAGGKPHARAQIASVRANACSVGGYCWLFTGHSPEAQVNGSINLADGVGVVLPVLWLDIEAYTDGSLPTASEVVAAVEACRARGIQPGIYTRRDIWAGLGNPVLYNTWLWVAAWDGNQTLDVAGFGGMRVMGHQYANHADDVTPLDMNVFDARATG